MNRSAIRIALAAAAAATGAFVALHRPAPEPAPAAARTGAYGFEDLAPESGLAFRMTFLEGEQGEHFKINLYDHGCGVAVADYDGDGDDDIYLCNQTGPNALFRNDGRGRFLDVTRMAGITVEDRISVAATFADVDGDGWPDLYVTNTRGGNLFFHNLGNGTFEDRTIQAGLAFVGHSEQATFFDADGDGDLDLLLTNTARWTTDAFEERTKHWIGRATIFDLLDAPIETNRFYRNRGDGTFADDTDASGLAGVGWGGDTAVFDFDEDGDLDVFIANMFGRSLLMRNDGTGRFTDVTRATLGRTPWGTVGAKAFDFDGDGLLDLFLVDMHSDMWMKAETPPSTIPERTRYPSPFGPMTAEQLAAAEGASLFMSRRPYEPRDVVFGNVLYRNLGGGRFEDVTDRAGAETLWPWGIAADDFDGDGYVDAFIPSGMGYPYQFWRSPLLMNDGHGAFVERSAAAGIEIPRGGKWGDVAIGGRTPARSSRSAAAGDFDGDGRPDLVVNNFNDRPFLYMNRFAPRPWLGLRLTGNKSNRDAIGARVRLQVGSRVLVRQVDAAGGYLAQSSRTLHFGLGEATRVGRAEIRWPSGIVQTIDDLPVGKVTSITEPVR